jgi:hypothetical protein
MRKIITAAFLLAALTATAFAQKADPYAAEDRAKEREAAVVDKQYKTILELTDKQASGKFDPWRNMRASDKAKQNR